MDSDAVLHEDSEYHFGCILWTIFHRAISSFWKRKLKVFKKMEKAKNVFCVYLWEDKSKTQTCYQNDQHKELYQL